MIGRCTHPLVQGRVQLVAATNDPPDVFVLVHEALLVVALMSLLSLRLLSQQTLWGGTASTYDNRDESGWHGDLLLVP